jgi:hypothetical protein
MRWEVENIGSAVALLVVAVVLVTVNHDFVADLEALDLRTDGPDDARCIGAGDVILGLVDVERRDRLAETCPDAVVVDARRHDENQNLVLTDGRSRDDFELHGLFGFAMALAPDCPGVHLRRHMAQRWDLAHIVEVLDCRTGRPGDDVRCLGHALFLETFCRRMLG